MNEIVTKKRNIKKTAYLKSLAMPPGLSMEITNDGKSVWVWFNEQSVCKMLFSYDKDLIGILKDKVHTVISEHFKQKPYSSDTKWNGLSLSVFERWEFQNKLISKLEPKSGYTKQLKI